MVKKVVVEEEIEDEIEDELVKEEEIKISKKTGCPIRKLSVLQQEVLLKGRVAALKKRLDMKESSNFLKKFENIKVAKEDKRNVTNKKIKDDLEQNKKNYEDELIKEDDGGAPPDEEKPIKKYVKKKKIKIIEYSSSSSDEEIQYVKKKINQK